MTEEVLATRESLSHETEAILVGILEFIDFESIPPSIAAGSSRWISAADFA
jgi:hypothetical protein